MSLPTVFLGMGFERFTKWRTLGIQVERLLHCYITQQVLCVSANKVVYTLKVKLIMTNISKFYFKTSNLCMYFHSPKASVDKWSSERFLEVLDRAFAVRAHGVEIRHTGEQWCDKQRWDQAWQTLCHWKACSPAWSIQTPWAITAKGLFSLSTSNNISFIKPHSHNYFVFNSVGDTAPLQNRFVLHIGSFPSFVKTTVKWPKLCV